MIDKNYKILNMNILLAQIKGILYTFKMSRKSRGISNLDTEIDHLIKIRASQLNNCSNSVNHYISNAIKAGLERKKLDKLHVWRNSELLSYKEKAALGIAEELVCPTDDEIDFKVFQWASQYFNDDQLQNVVFQVNKMNYWNNMKSGAAILYGSMVILAENNKGLFQSPYYHK